MGPRLAWIDLTVICACYVRGISIQSVLMHVGAGKGKGKGRVGGLV